jgi:all-trans-retinol 13,14-reductase
MEMVHDTIVIGSGIGGLACACALAKCGHRVLVLEQHYSAGGLTSTFSRKGFTWNVGILYLGEMGPKGQARRLLDWLSNGAIRMAPIGSAYDIVHFPDDFKIIFESPAEALRQNLKERFPQSSGEIDVFFSLLGQMARKSSAPFRLRVLPSPLAWIYSLWTSGKIRRWWGRTIDEVLSEMISDQKLRSVMTAQWGGHGGRPAEGSFAMHAMIMNHFLDGAFYPLGGAQTFADSLIPTIKNAGGEVRVKSPVKEILVTNGKATGVRLEDSSEHHARRVVSAIGAWDTVQQLLSQSVGDRAWAKEILSFRPSCSHHICLYLGFEGDIRAAGATDANHWIYETWDTNSAIWKNPEATDIPLLFVSFPSLKDPRHEAGEKQKHTGEVLTWVNWEVFRKWENSRHGGRPEDYKEFKQLIEEKMLSRFKHHFPEIASLITYHELSTPLSMAYFVGRQQGTSYGLETTPRRFLSRSLNVRTPIKGLYLAGQDVVTPGITGAMMGGILAAAAIDPRIFRQL